MLTTDLLVVGAGPFGLALAAEAGRRSLPHVVVGRPMSFWREQMPAGMLLRSASDWHLDTAGDATIEAFLETRGLTPTTAEPLSRELYLDYCAWFAEQKELRPVPQHVDRLDRDADGFVATLEDGDRIRARAVVLALGMGPHRREPTDVVGLLPAGSWEHTCDAVDLSGARGLRYLLVGGRQSAFEWAALLVEAGATSVEVVHRHDSPAFAAADWTWVGPLVDAMVQDPGWFHRLPAAEQEEYRRRLWAEGRLKVEPWLEARLPDDVVTVRPRTAMSAVRRRGDGSLAVTFDTGVETEVDRILLATGYLPRLERLALLTAGNLPPLAERDGYPVLDDSFQSSVPGLYLTSLPAAEHFGPFFGFTISARMSAAVIGRAVAERRAPVPPVPVA